MQPTSPSQNQFLPWQTIFVAAATLVIASSPTLSATLTATRDNWPQLWPLLTGHLCHWTGSHLFWDLIVFVIAGTMVERRLGRAFLPCLGLVSVVITATVFLLMPQIESYRGLSGIDTFLYMFAVIDLIREAYSRTPYKLRGLIFLPLILLFSKTLLEVMTGEALFSGPLGEQVVPLPLAHAAGAILGVLVSQFRRWASIRRERKINAASFEITEQKNPVYTTGS